MVSSGKEMYPCNAQIITTEKRCSLLSNGYANLPHSGVGLQVGHSIEAFAHPRSCGRARFTPARRRHVRGARPYSMVDFAEGLGQPQTHGGQGRTLVSVTCFPWRLHSRSGFVPEYGRPLPSVFSVSKSPNHRHHRHLQAVGAIFLPHPGPKICMLPTDALEIMTMTM
ncbi:hypothetical protein CC78DRAFT_581116 [Lojkania enalia]|uniref:Uncharacterized protein n=1 Tax=Lojkania enalia TaxID=147567 RepID=A0A9P4KCU4_9PLEO|nr:hypothetical protein CC78DRAFT_581116 [Didymosphaeria enalia]